MKKILLLIILIQNICIPQSGWYVQNSGTSAALMSTFFTDSLSGVIVGTNGTILKTADGGENWQQINSGTTNNLSFVSFINSQVGTIVGFGGIILRTEDGGDSWIQQSSGITSILEGVSFYDENNGVAVGGNTILRTTNGGQNWEILTNGVLQYSFKRVQYINYDNILIISNWTSSGYYSSVYKTTNAGLSWSNSLVLSSPASCTFADLQFLNPNVGFVLGGRYAAGANWGYVYKTTNGGATWAQLLANLPVYLNSVCFINENYGFIVGNGKILRTTDGGENWVHQLSTPTIVLNGVFFSNQNIGTCVGNNGLIYRTTSGGINPNSKIWSQVNFGNVANIKSVCFPNSNIGFCLGREEYNDLIIKTTNGGISWFSIGSGYNTINGYDIWFGDTNNGSIVGKSGTSPQFGGIMFNTTNGGQDWQKYIFDQNLNEMSYRIARGIYYIDNLRRIIVAQYGRILYTLDGGVTWTKSDSVTAWDLNDLSFPNAEVGYVVGDRGTILKSTDSGISWSLLQSNTNDNLYGVSFIDALNGTIVGVSGKILRTTDGGISWSTLQSGTLGNLNKIAFDHYNNGIIVGNMGTVLISSNGGETWEHEISGTSLNLNAISMTDSLAVAVGEYGTILRKQNSTLDASEVDSENSNNYCLFQNYPNPFNPSTKINYQIPVAGNVSIKVYDVLGNEIATLVNDYKIAGSYEVEFNTASRIQHPASGIYFYRLQAGSFIETKKMILLK